MRRLRRTSWRRVRVRAGLRDALGLIKFGIDAAAETIPGLNATIATGIAVPVVIVGGWYVLQRVRAHLGKD